MAIQISSKVMTDMKSLAHQAMVEETVEKYGILSWDSEANVQNYTLRVRMKLVDGVTVEGEIPPSVMLHATGGLAPIVMLKALSESGGELTLSLPKPPKMKPYGWDVDYAETPQYSPKTLLLGGPKSGELVSLPSGEAQYQVAMTPGLASLLPAGEVPPKLTMEVQTYRMEVVKKDVSKNGHPMWYAAKVLVHESVPSLAIAGFLEAAMEEYPALRGHRDYCLFWSGWASIKVEWG